MAMTIIQTSRGAYLHTRYHVDPSGVAGHNVDITMRMIGPGGPIPSRLDVSWILNTSLVVMPAMGIWRHTQLGNIARVGDVIQEEEIELAGEDPGPGQTPGWDPDADGALPRIRPPWTPHSSFQGAEADI
ncbi:hypothetical protein EJ05DRAFT_503707 [Pseudovirgaria hyperparasitica]|uniref:Uncharacterized protein n=1 Tax=Pseudovirgaria hyperparasitica TaxID=470096 RepID=A0A6A6W102_9PEZI|nr:uncharacterized protein EJ05DRAFT_503707 [Pseudovirgaria hyperparasitica]KAF2754761.1 hypothetical protein EJ05DRAFT_503707 [Pseudovirgaria hyperparasitica]